MDTQKFNTHLNVAIIEDTNHAFLHEILIQSGHTPITVATLYHLIIKPHKIDAIIIGNTIDDEDTHFLNFFRKSNNIPTLILSEWTSKSIGQFGITFINKGEDTKAIILKWLETLCTSIENTVRTAHYHDTNKIFSLMYISQADEKTDELVLSNILNTARKTNKELGITGVLVYRKGWYLQYLEGEFSTVTTLFYDHILRDARHEDITPVLMEYTKTRQFANWNMGFFSSEIAISSEHFTDLEQHSAGQFISEKLKHHCSLMSHFIR
jgi:hypothetical protein